VFAKTNIQFGYMDYESDYTAIIVHPKWNLIFFVVKENSSRMTWTTEKFKPSLPVPFGMVDIPPYQGS
jgi:hypothetical protein